MDAAAQMPFAPLPAASDPVQDITIGPEPGAANGMALGPQPPGPWGDLFVAALQQQLAAALGGMPAAAAAAVAAPGSPAELPGASAEQTPEYGQASITALGVQWLSASGKFLPPGLPAAASGPWWAERSALPPAAPESLGDDSDAASLPREVLLELRWVTREARLAFEGQLAPVPDADDASLAMRTEASAAAQPLAAVADSPDVLPGVVTVLPVEARDAGATMMSSPIAATGTIPVAPGSAGWNEALGERILWLVGNRVSAAQLSLNPPELGPLEVRIVCDGADKVQVHFVSAHQVVREALEQALPRLRELFGAAGLQLLGADVRHDWGGAAGGHGGEPAAPLDLFEAVGESEGTARADSPHPAIRWREGLVDLFA